MGQRLYWKAESPVALNTTQTLATGADPLYAGVQWMKLNQLMKVVYIIYPTKIWFDNNSEIVHDADTDDETGGMRIADMDMDDENEEEDDDIVMEEDRFEDNHCSSIITEPGQATTLQRKWIAAMSDGKNEEVARRFQL